MKKHIILLCSALLWVSTAYAIDPPSMDTVDLTEALSNAYRTNENIRTAQQQFLTDSEIFPQALSSFLPDVSMSIVSTKAKTTNVSQFGTGSNEVGPDIARSIQVTQNIFNGGKSAYAIKIAQAGFLVSKATLYSSEQKILTDALSAYLGLWGAGEKYDIAITAVEFASQNLNMIREKKYVGNATITDVAAAEAQLAQAHSNKSQQFATLMSAKSIFQTVVGIDANNISYPPIPDNMPENLESFKAIVEKSNFDLIAAKSGFSQSKDSIKRAQGDLLPKADLVVSAGHNYNNPESPNRANSRSVSTRVTLTIPIFSQGGATYSNIRQAKYKSRQAVYGLDYIKKQILGNVTSSWEGFAAMKDAIISSEEAIKSQALTLEGVKSGYEVGTQTMLDILTQQDKLNQLKSNNIDVKTQYLKVAYQLKALMGQMTAQKLSLNAKYFNPEAEFRNLKHKIVGF